MNKIADGRIPVYILFILSLISSVMLIINKNTSLDISRFQDTRNTGKEYPKPLSVKPEPQAYTLRAAALFPHSPQADNNHVSKNRQIPEVSQDIDFSLIGYISTQKETLFSFRNNHTGEKLFLRRGIKNGDFLLLETSGHHFTVMYKNRIYKGIMR